MKGIIIIIKYFNKNLFRKYGAYGLLINLKLPHTRLRQKQVIVIGLARNNCFAGKVIAKDN